MIGGKERCIQVCLQSAVCLVLFQGDHGRQWWWQRNGSGGAATGSGGGCGVCGGGSGGGGRSLLRWRHYATDNDDNNQLKQQWRLDQAGQSGKYSLHWGVGTGPSVYRTDALPLSYRGFGHLGGSDIEAQNIIGNVQLCSCAGG